jgi:hypothetical protein
MEWQKDKSEGFSRSFFFPIYSHLTACERAYTAQCVPLAGAALASSSAALPRTPSPAPPCSSAPETEGETNIFFDGFSAEFDDTYCIHWHYAALLLFEFVQTTVKTIQNPFLNLLRIYFT